MCYEGMSLFTMLNITNPIFSLLIQLVLTSPILKMVNLNFKFEVGVIVGPRPAGDADVTALQTAFGSSLANYPWSNFKVIEKAACPAI